MTLVAVAPKAAVVDIVFTVTGNTGRRQAYISSDRPTVTGKAVNTFMAAIELVSGTGLMVELPQ